MGRTGSNPKDIAFSFRKIYTGYNDTHHLCPKGNNFMNASTATALIVIGVLNIALTGTAITGGIILVKKLNKDVNDVKAKSQKLVKETKNYFSNISDLV